MISLADIVALDFYGADSQRKTDCLKYCLFPVCCAESIVYQTFGKLIYKYLLPNMSNFCTHIAESIFSLQQVVKIYCNRLIEMSIVSAIPSYGRPGLSSLKLFEQPHLKSTVQYFTVDSNGAESPKTSVGSILSLLFLFKIKHYITLNIQFSPLI